MGVVQGGYLPFKIALDGLIVDVCFSDRFNFFPATSNQQSACKFMSCESNVNRVQSGIENLSFLKNDTFSWCRISLQVSSSKTSFGKLLTRPHQAPIEPRSPFLTSSLSLIDLSCTSTLVSSPDSSVDFDKLCFEPVSCTGSKALLTEFRLDQTKE